MYRVLKESAQKRLIFTGLSRILNLKNYQLSFVGEIMHENLLFKKDDNLGVLMSTVYSVHVGGWASVGACSAEGVGGPAGPAGGRLGIDQFRSVTHA